MSSLSSFYTIRCKTVLCAQASTTVGEAQNIKMLLPAIKQMLLNAVHFVIFIRGDRLSDVHIPDCVRLKI